MEIYCTTCCKAKRRDTQLLPAIERYMSDRITAVDEFSQKKETPFFILSGKIGLISRDAKIPYYDVPLEAEEVDNMVKKVVIQLKHFKITKIIFYALPLVKNPSWEPYYNLIEKSCKEANVELKHEKFTQNLK